MLSRRRRSPGPARSVKASRTDWRRMLSVYLAPTTTGWMSGVDPVSAAPRTMRRVGLSGAWSVVDGAGGDVAHLWVVLHTAVVTTNNSWPPGRLRRNQKGPISRAFVMRPRGFEPPRPIRVTRPLTWSGRDPIV